MISKISFRSSSGAEGNQLEVEDDRDLSNSASDDASSSLWGGISSAAQTLAGIATGSLDTTGGPPDPYQLNRDVFDNNLENLENIWKKDR